ncbi:sensor histidine kinase [Thermomonospora cellulosilytica]|uniref:histidine kinase n=1 Tax=Thermomonospora cellulosilytica TaxID=1411118 RepID=A0A7W3N195_9ACTN|nr:sensor histidine kinase [Thermomonospora cellulosilytica]MBA9005710.1 signal transduction histidine kinase [Thermomonospora cellulosilytica]
MIIPDRWVGVASAAGLGTVFLTAIAVQAIAIAQTWGAWYWVPGGGAAVAVCLLALLRQRWPVWAAVGGLGVAALAIVAAGLADRDLPAEPSPALTLGLAVLVGSALRVLPPVPAGAVAGGGLAVVVAGQFTAGPSSPGITGVTVLDGLFWLAAVAVGLSLRLLDARARATAERVRRAERLELARELHDVVAHHITGMLIQAQAAQVVARRNPEEVTGSLVEIEAAGADALAAMRRVVGLLRDADDAAPVSPGPERLSELVERFGRRGPKVCLSVPDEDVTWPPEVTSTVYRIVQEALTNVLRHAPHARSVSVTVDRDPRGVTVEVVDDAPPTSVRHHRGGYGLIGMRERVETLGGSLSAGPRAGAGWSVRATLPVPAREPG